MASRTIAMAILALGLCSSAAFAQALDQEPTGFYADPVLPDPPKTVAHAYPASEATADVAAVAPAAGAPAKPQHVSACTALSPCAAVAPAARG